MANANSYYFPRLAAHPLFIHENKKAISTWSKRPEKRGPHWSITKREAVNRRRRVIDDVWLTETISITDEVLVSYSRYFDETVSMADAVALGNDKLFTSLLNMVIDLLLLVNEMTSIL